MCCLVACLYMRLSGNGDFGNVLLTVIVYCDKLLRRELRARGVQVTRSAGSDLIVALCRAEQPDQALRVYEDMTASAWGAASLALQHAAADAPMKPSMAEPAPAAEMQAHANPAAAASTAAVPEQPSPSAASPAALLEPLQQPEAAPAAHDSQSLPAKVQREDEALPGARLQLKGPPQRPVAGNLQQAAEPQQAGDRHQQNAHAGWGNGADMRSSSNDGGTPGQADQGGQQRQPKQAKLKPAVIPHIAALGALVGALARANDLEAALRLYAQVWPRGKAAACLHLCCFLEFLPCACTHCSQFCVFFLPFFVVFYSESHEKKEQCGC
jgi:pentatricopeptide repeat protein